ncbi:MAG: ATP phosphoribosyltransferase regulatory subunit, partial [Mycobacteriales bacterium]
MPRPTPISGFPEWLPRERIIEQHLLDTLRRSFELHGFASIETRAVEPLDALLRKGETSKEVYVLRRLQAEDAEAPDAGLGLHFDLTVPFARYVLENAGRLHFPLRRYQIQKAWRGERPQEGRYREFAQADIDVVGADTLPAHYEAELPLVVAEALSAFPMPPFTIHTNDRRLVEGFYRGLGITEPGE